MEELKGYRRRILLGYTIAGVATSLVILFATAKDMLEEIPLPRAMFFLAIMVIPLCVGSIVAKDISSLDESWSPLAHWQALKDEAPILLGAMALILVIDAAFYLAELPRLMPFPPILIGWLLNSWMREP